MGNVSSSSSEDNLALSAVARYANITKPQIMEMRRICATSENDRIRRKLFQLAMSKANIRQDPDAEILDLLFTMWNVNGDSRVPYLQFMVSLAPLSCRYENLASAMHFILKVMDEEENGTVTSSELITILKSINNTAGYLGDSLMTELQMYKISDSVFDTITMISTDDVSISHSECVQILLQEPLIHHLMKPKKKTRVTFSDTKKNQSSSNGEQQQLQQPYQQQQQLQQQHQFDQTTRLEEDSLISTDVSSVLLSPNNNNNNNDRGARRTTTVVQRYYNKSGVPQPAMLPVR